MPWCRSLDSVAVLQHLVPPRHSQDRPQRRAAAPLDLPCASRREKCRKMRQFSSNTRSVVPHLAIPGCRGCSKIHQAGGLRPRGRLDGAKVPSMPSDRPHVSRQAAHEDFYDPSTGDVKGIQRRIRNSYLAPRRDGVSTVVTRVGHLVDLVYGELASCLSTDHPR
jgi:hypothetical protein